MGIVLSESDTCSVSAEFLAPPTDSNYADSVRQL